MSSYLIIDGYNLINNWPRLIKAKQKGIESARTELFNLIQPYSDYTTQKGIIVYDGSQKERSVEEGNPKVIYSKKGESADTVIESLVYNLEDKSRVKVVTDDKALQNLIVGMGASVISPKSLESEIRSASSSMRGFIEERADRINRGIDL